MPELSLKQAVEWPIESMWNLAGFAGMIDRMRLSIVLLLIVASTTGCATVERAPPQFRAGDIVVARYFTRHPELNGTQVLVTGDFGWRWIKGGSALRCYSVKTVDGQELAAQTFQLQPIAATQQ